MKTYFMCICIIYKKVCYKMSNNEAIATFIIPDRVVIINGHTYRRVMTCDGKYSKQDRNQYMRAYRAKRAVKCDL